MTKMPFDLNFGKLLSEVSVVDSINHTTQWVWRFTFLLSVKTHSGIYIISQWTAPICRVMAVFLSLGLQTPILHLNKTTPYESEEFTATCSAPEEKGSLIFRFYQRFRTGGSQKIKQPAPTGNSSETTLVLRLVGDSILYCDYEINLVSGPRHSNRSNEIPVIVKGD